MIKIFIPSWRRPDSTTTPALLRQCGVYNFKLVVRENEYEAYRRNHPTNTLMVIGRHDDLTDAREQCRRTLKKGEWCLQMDDNVRGFIQCSESMYMQHDEVPLGRGEKMVTRAKWQRHMNHDVKFTHFYELAVEDSLHVAEERGAWLVGFSAHDNPAFRFRKYTDVGYVCGKTMLMRNQGLPWKQCKVSSGEDYALTAAHLYENGRVLINKWAHPKRVHYQPGGCGPYEERLPAMMRAQKELIERYGDLFGIKNANAPEKKQGELRIRFNHLAQVEYWRDMMHRLRYDPNMRVKK